MWIVRLALRRPYTSVVMAILILIMGSSAIVRTPTDIFPNIDIPVVSIIWNYNRLIPENISDRIVSVTERALTTTVDNIEHIESQSRYGIAVVKVFLQPNKAAARGDACERQFKLTGPHWLAGVTRGTQEGVDYAPPHSDDCFIMAFPAETSPTHLTPVLHFRPW